MIGTYPDHATYRALYLKYIVSRDAEELLELLDPMLDARFLDLCCGEGQLSFGAISEGVRSVIAVDGQREMIPQKLRSERVVETMCHEVHAALELLMLRRSQFDRIACRQAVNYWLGPESALLLREVLVPGGIFAFNTFNQVPPTKPRVLEYTLEGHAFTELSWLADGKVHHVQAREGLKPHYTSFQWISPERYREILEPHFEVEEFWKGKTSLYRCVRK